MRIFFKVSGLCLESRSGLFFPSSLELNSINGKKKLLENSTQLFRTHRSLLRWRQAKNSTKASKNPPLNSFQAHFSLINRYKKARASSRQTQLRWKKMKLFSLLGKLGKLGEI
jgi:hypothetical protein